MSISLKNTPHPPKNGGLSHKGRGESVFKALALLVVLFLGMTTSTAYADDSTKIERPQPGTFSTQVGKHAVLNESITNSTWPAPCPRNEFDPLKKFTIVCPDINGNPPPGKTIKDINCPPTCTVTRFPAKDIKVTDTIINAVCPADYTQTAQYNSQMEYEYKTDVTERRVPHSLKEMNEYPAGKTCQPDMPAPDWPDRCDTSHNQAKGIPLWNNGDWLDVTKPPNPLGIPAPRVPYMPYIENKVVVLFEAQKLCYSPLLNCTGATFSCGGSFLDFKYNYRMAQVSCIVPAPGNYPTNPTRYVPISIVCAHVKPTWQPIEPTTPPPAS
jgi:hypothetical protein